MASRGRALVGALVFCALSICAFAAVSASASELTAVTCKEVGVGGKYNTSHCSTPAESGNFETVALPLNTTTEVESTSTEQEPTLRATIGGINLTIQCTTGHQIGATITNTEPTTGKHKIGYTASAITYTGCKAMLKSNEARTCEVETITGPVPGETGKIATISLKGETTGVEHKVRFEPEEGTTFTEFGIHGKEQAAGKECFFAKTVKVAVAGALEGEVSTSNHAHLTFTEANNGTGLKVNGAAVKYLDTVGGTMKGTENTVGAQTFT
jgi:hypothetical protein